MRVFWHVVAFICAVIFFVIMCFKNLGALVHNIFYRTKRPISWHPSNEIYQYGDETEDFYHR